LVCIILVYSIQVRKYNQDEIRDYRNATTKIQLQKEKEDLMAELEAIKSLTRIEEEALVKLGMDYPTEDQVVYISVDDCH